MKDYRGTEVTTSYTLYYYSRENQGVARKNVWFLYILFFIFQTERPRIKSPHIS